MSTQLNKMDEEVSYYEGAVNIHEILYGPLTKLSVKASYCDCIKPFFP